MPKDPHHRERAGQPGPVPPRNAANEGRRAGHGLRRLIRSRRRWNRETRWPAMSRDGKGVTAGPAAKGVRHPAGMEAHGTNGTTPRNRPGFHTPVVVVSAPASGSTTTRASRYATTPPAD